jgi:hypothetical protein
VLSNLAIEAGLISIRQALAKGSLSGINHPSNRHQSQKGFSGLAVWRCGGEITMWDAIEHKLDGAEFFFGEMGRDLVSPAVGNPTMAAIAISTGATVGHPWQQRFYHHLDAFLALARSVPDIVRCCFGIDPVMGSWLSSLDPAERARRQAFQAKFTKPYEDFKKLPLSGVRNVALHRGVTPVEVQITGRWGVYTGGPLEIVPESETPTIVAGNDPSLMWASTEPGHCSSSQRFLVYHNDRFRPNKNGPFSGMQ